MRSTLRTHAALDTLDYQDGVLVWGGKKVTDIAGQLGRTPFYAYDRGRMTTGVAELRRAMPSKLRIHYALKANPMSEVVQHMVDLVDGLDVASAGELRVALATGITISMESENEMRRIAKIGETIGTPLDLIGDNVQVGPVREGSLIAILQSGAYGLTASPGGFLSHAPCRETLV